MIINKTFRKIYAVPDIHGRLDLLDEGLQMMKRDGMDLTQDLFVVVGDMIDRGPDSKGVLDRLIQLQTLHPDNVVVIRGNHDDFAVDYRVKNPSPDMKYLWYANGGDITEGGYPNGVMSEEHLRFLGGLPYQLEVQGFFFSHAPVPRDHKRNGRMANWGMYYGLKGEDYNVYELTWHYVGPECEKPGSYMDVHEGPRSDNGKGPDHLIGICGHIHRLPRSRTVRIFPRYRMLDAGCGCMPDAPLAIHECVSNRTMYVAQLPVNPDGTVTKFEQDI